jgi:mono/diheme cytochrome c family protein
MPAMMRPKSSPARIANPAGVRRGSAAREGLVFTLLVLAPLACSGSAQQEPAADQPEVAAAVDPRAEALARGRLLYEGNCASCHGPGARGDGPLAASLPVAPANVLEHLGDHSYEDMVKMVVEGIPPAMPPATIGSEDVRLILNYVWTLVPESQVGLLRSLQEQAAESH